MRLETAQGRWRLGSAAFMSLKVLHFGLTMVLSATVLMPAWFLLMRFGGFGFLTSALFAIVIFTVVWMFFWRILVRR